MSKNNLSKLYSREKKYIVGKNLPKEEQQEVYISTLCLDDAHLLESDPKASQKEQMNQIKSMLAKCLKESEDSVSKISFEYMPDLIAAISDAHNIGDLNKRTDIKKFIDEKKELSSKKEDE